MPQIKTKMRQIRKIKGFTLTELVVALGIFVVIITIAASVLLYSLRSLRHVAHQAGAMDNISLAMEQMAREVRMGANIAPVNGGVITRERMTAPVNGGVITRERMTAPVNGGVITRERRTAVPNGEEVLHEEFSFINHENNIITYSFCGTRMCRQGMPITMSNTIIRGGFLISNFDGEKTPRITITARAEDMRGNTLGLVQTTISARLIHYKQ